MSTKPAEPQDPRSQSQPYSVHPAHTHRPSPRTSPENDHVPPPYQMFLTPVKTLSVRSWCLMSTNESTGPTTKITMESLFDIRPQTCAHVDHQRALVSSPSHPVLVILYCAFCNVSDSPPCHLRWDSRTGTRPGARVPGLEMPWNPDIALL